MKIESYSFGSIKISGQTYSHDVLILPTGVESWWKKEGHSVCLEDLEKIWQFDPNVVLFGKGDPGLMKIPESVKNHLIAKGIELATVSTKVAVDLYNDCIEKSPEKVVIGAFHLTC